MASIRWSTGATALCLYAAFARSGSAAPIAFTQQFPGGFSVSVNGGPLAPSGPITIVGIVDSATADIDPDIFYGEFPLASVTFSGAGFVNRPVATPLSLSIFSTSNFAFQRLGENNEGITGWNGDTKSGSFIFDVNNLSTLGSLPYTTTGSSTFWYDGLGANLWALALGGDTIGGNIGAGGPNGTFSINNIPEPASAFLAIAAASILAPHRRRMTA